MNFSMTTMKRLFVYKCKLSLALLYLADMFLNNFKTKLNVFVFTEEFQTHRDFKYLQFFWKNVLFIGKKT